MAVSQKLLNDGEDVVISTRTHIKALLGPLLVLVVLLAAAVAVQVWVDERTLTIAVWALVGAAVVWFVLRPFLLWLTAYYAFTTRRMITRRGIIVRRGHDIPLSRISDVASEVSILDRLFGCGTLVISDASTFGQVLLPDIPKVEHTQRRLNELLHGMHTAAPRDEGV